MTQELFINHLAGYGYLPVRHPRQNIGPLDVLRRASTYDLEFFGVLSSIFRGDGSQTYPAITPDSPAANLSGEHIKNLQVGVGLQILGAIIGAFGGRFGAEASYKNAKTVSIAYEDVTQNEISAAELWKYLNSSDVEPSVPQFVDLANRNELFVVTATAKCKKVKVEAKDSSATGVKLDIPDIQGAVGGNVSVSPETGKESVVTFKGNNPIIFGVRVALIMYTNGKFSGTEAVIEKKTLRYTPPVSEETTIPRSFVEIKGY